MKRLEHLGKNLLDHLLVGQHRRIIPPREQIRRILILRLDQKIGNGLLLVPLLRAIADSDPHIEVDLLIHHPVARLLKQTATPHLVHQVWDWNQERMLHKPWLLVALLRQLQRQQYDLVISASNPDSYSMSQALFSRWLRSGLLSGFQGKRARSPFDITPPGRTDIHYADAMIDLWRPLNPAASLQFGGLQIPKQLQARFEALSSDLNPTQQPSILFWLGATRGKQLTLPVINRLRELLPADLIHYAAGPADEQLLSRYPADIGQRTTIWTEALPLTAAMFSRYQLFVSADTGPLHLAVALGLPTLSVFMKGKPQQYGYQDGVRHFTLYWPTEEDQLETVLNRLAPLYSSNRP